MSLLGDGELERSAAVANCRMNRERNLTGSNGYAKEIGFDPLDFLKGRLAPGRPAAWLDLCCGTGRALIQAARIVHADGLAVEIVGVDLVGMFDRLEPDLTRLRLVEAALAVTRFGGIARGYADRETAVAAEGPSVAKWGNWHCGEDKARFDDTWTALVPTLFEQFVEGEAVRIVLVGERAWQVQMAGEGWLRSIHHPEATFMPIDSELLNDARRLADHFDLRTVGVDSLVAPDGGRYLLEVNHVPNMTVFPEVREAYLDVVVEWASKPESD